MVSVLRWYHLGLTALLCFFGSSIVVFAAEGGIASIHDGRPYILNITAGTLQQDAQIKLTESGYKNIEKTKGEMIYSKGGHRVLLAINPNTGNTIQSVEYTSSDYYSAKTIADLGGAFEILSSENLKCREALPYSVDCLYKIDNEQGRYSLKGVFQQGGIHYVLTGAPKYTVLTRVKSNIAKPVVMGERVVKNPNSRDFSFGGLYVGMKRSNADKIFREKCASAKPKFAKQRWTCDIRDQSKSKSLKLDFLEKELLSKISFYMTFESAPKVGQQAFEEHRVSFVNSSGENACINRGLQSVCNWTDGTRVARLKYHQGHFLQYSFEYKQ